MSTRLQFRTDAATYREIMARKPADLTLSAWIRKSLLGEPAVRARVRPRRTAIKPQLSEPERIRALAMTSLLVQLVELTERGRQAGHNISPAMEEELRELLGHVREKILSL